VPIISAFFGIVIRMYHKEHEPAHFHAEHAGQQTKFLLRWWLIAGAIASRRALPQIRLWAQRHRAELETGAGAPG
jgi:hypothetical protein